jgi:ATP-dependent Lon protease
LVSVVQEEPYLIMEAEAFESQARLRSRPKRALPEFKELVKQWIFLNPEVSDQLILAFNDFEDFGQLSDFFAFHFLKKAKDKQVYLDCADPFERSERLASFIEKELIRFKEEYVLSRVPRLLH